MKIHVNNDKITKKSRYILTITIMNKYTFTDIDYADDVALLVDKEESFHTALAAMDEEASKFGLRVSWTKTKIQNQGRP